MDAEGWGMSAAGMPPLFFLLSSVRKLLKTLELRFSAKASVCKRIKRKDLLYCGRVVLEVARIYIFITYIL